MSSTPYKLNPSDFAFLWEECPRCFYLKVKRGVKRPRVPLPSVFIKYHDLLQRYFFGASTDRLDPSLPSGIVMHGETWVVSRPLHVGTHQTACYISGRIDTLLRFDDGTWGLVDFKTSERRDAHIPLYRRQLHAYAWALERAAPTAVQVAPITRMGLLCLDPQQLRTFEPEEEALAALKPTWIEMERDDEAFEGYLAEVMSVLTQDDPPEADPDCPYCRYYTRLRTFANQDTVARVRG